MTRQTHVTRRGELDESATSVQSRATAMIGVILSVEGHAVQASPREPAGASFRRCRCRPMGRFLQTSDGKPFFWTADTGWLAIERLTREETGPIPHRPREARASTSSR